MRCPRCDSDNAPEARYCASCGAQLTAAEAGSGAVVQETCPKCGRPVRPDDKFCGNCGSAIDRPQPAHREVTPSQSAAGTRCPRCQAVNPSGSRFCGGCGASLAAAPPQPPGAAAATAPEDLTEQLAHALRLRDRAGGQSGADDAVAAAAAEVRRVKALIAQRLEETSAELDALTREQGLLHLRYQAGQYNEAQFRNVTADSRSRIASLEPLEKSLEAMLNAETEAGLLEASEAAPTRSVVAPASTRKAAGRETPAARKEAPVTRKEARIEAGKDFQVGSQPPVTNTDDRGDDEPAKQRAYASRKPGTGGIPAPRWMLIGSGVVIAVGAIAFVVLVIQFLAGPFSLPSPSLPFGGDGDGPGAPTILPPTTVPGPTATAPAPGPSTAPMGAEFQVPVQLRSAPGVGSLLVVIGYDAADIEIVKIEAAGLPSGTLLEYGRGEGRISIGMVNSDGLKGDWVAVFITCRRAAGAATSGDSNIVIAKVEAHSASDLAELPASGLSGQVNLSSLSVVAPAVTFG